MPAPLRRFQPTQTWQESRDELNAIVDALDMLLSMQGDGLVKVTQTAAGTTFGLNMQGIRARMPKALTPGSFLAEVTSHTPANNYCTVERITTDPIAAQTKDGVSITGVWVASDVDLDGYLVLVVRTGIAARPFMAIWTDCQAEDESTSAAAACV